MDTSVQVALVTTFGTIVVALIGAWAASERAVAPLRTRVAELETWVRANGGNPDEI